MENTPTPLNTESSEPPLAPDPAAPSFQRPEPFEPPVQPPKKSKKMVLWAIGALVVVGIAVGVGYFLGTSKPAPTSAVTSVSPSPSVSKTLDAQAVIDEIKTQKIQGSAMQVTTSDATTGETSDKTRVYTASFYQLPGKGFATDPKQAYGTGYHGSKSVATADFKTIANYLTSHNFTSVKYTSPNDDAEINPMYVNAARYSSKTVFCSIEQNDYSKSISKEALTDNLTAVWCADLSSYAANADPLQPFFDAYVKNPKYQKSTDPLATPYLSVLKINDGVDGYKNASVDISAVGAVVGGFEGLYYQEPGKDWQYLLGTQDTLNCKDFTTTILKKAFSGQQCYGGTSADTLTTIKG